MRGELFQMVGGYFHQEYELLYASADAALSAYRTGRECSSLQNLVSEVDEALRSLSEEELARLWDDELQASYDPGEDGLTYRQWFVHIRETLS